MNQDIDNIYGSSQKKKEKLSSPGLNNKKAQIRAEKRLKEDITSKPFNMGAIKNLKNVRNDVSPQRYQSPTTRKS
jgi:hypothetical protein